MTAESPTAAGGAESVAPAAANAGHYGQSHASDGKLKLAVGAVGVVFGDIGTSPLYAFRETFAGHHSIEVDRLRLAAPVGSDIVKGLDNLFRVKGGGILPDDPEARLVTRSIEGSNVAATTALVEMIEASRSWDNQIKLVSDARDMDSATANLMQLPR